MDGVFISGSFLDPLSGTQGVQGPKDKATEQESASEAVTSSPQAHHLLSLFPRALRAIRGILSTGTSGLEHLSHLSTKDMERLCKDLQFLEKKMAPDDSLGPAIKNTIQSIQKALEGLPQRGVPGLKTLSLGLVLKDCNYDQQDRATQNFTRSLVKLYALSSSSKLSSGRVLETQKGLMKGSGEGKQPSIIQLLDRSPIVDSFIKSVDKYSKEGGEKALKGLPFWSTAENKGLVPEELKNDPSFQALEALSSAMRFLKKSPTQAKRAQKSNPALASQATRTVFKTLMPLFREAYPSAVGLGVLGGALQQVLCEQPRIKSPKPALEAAVVTSGPAALASSQMNAIDQALDVIEQSFQAVLDFLSGDPSPPSVEQWEGVWKAGTCFHNFQVWYNNMPSDPPPGLTEDQWATFADTCTKINNAISKVLDTAQQLYASKPGTLNSIFYDLFHHNNGSQLHPTPLDKAGISSISPATTEGPNGTEYWTNEVTITFDNGKSLTLPIDYAMNYFVLEFNSLYGSSWSTTFLGDNQKTVDALTAAIKAAEVVVGRSQDKWGQVMEDNMGIIAYAIKELEPIANKYTQEIQALSEIASYTADLVSAYAAVENFLSGNPSPPSVDQWAALWDAGTTFTNYQTWYASLPTDPPPGVSQDQWNQFTSQAAEINTDISNLYSDIENPESYPTWLDQVMIDMLTHFPEYQVGPGLPDGVAAVAPDYKTGPDGQPYLTDNITIILDDGTTETIPIDQAMEEWVPSFNNYMTDQFGSNFWQTQFIGYDDNQAFIQSVLGDINTGQNDLMNISDTTQANLQKIESLLMTLAKMFEMILSTINKMTMTVAQSYSS